ncbi:glycosyl hydrolase 43 family protein [Caulobacter sp. 602-2]|uniref:Glycosyl hydrolase 43 family protein n=1 Tax=Caulobacter sp. 602-2 TaxID=2710887 RepID=A0A6G4QTT4_9CAUL|nr:glycosyl hydrolase 43 family protein [Caulobacter sp. 602-2]
MAGFGRGALGLGLVAAAALLAASASAADGARAERAWLPDQGDGTYKNPVLAGDYSDPDAVRVGDAYYLVSSSFTNVPGLPILKSTDLVNWTIIGHALTAITPEAHHATPRRGGGVWAPAIRHRNGEFLIYYPDPDFGVFLVKAKDPAGPWSKPVLVDDRRGVIDPAPFWDDDGQGWLVTAFARSRAGFANVVTARRLNKAGDQAVGEAITLVEGDKHPKVATSQGPFPWMTTEGPKLYKRDGWYYLFTPSGSVKGGWQGVFRSRKLEGPYEGRNVLDQGRTQINGPHQGAWVSTPTGEDWFLHFQDADSYGRRVWLEPMAWKDGWPVIGEDKDGDGIGEPVLVHRKPASKTPSPRLALEDSDDFDGALSLAWQWNANPAADWADLKAAQGKLRLKSISSPENLWETGALLTQKLPAERFSATTRLDFAPKAVGERAGLVMFGSDYAWIGLQNTGAGPALVRVDRTGADKFQPERVEIIQAEAPTTVWLRMTAEPVVVADPPPDFSPYWPSMLRSLHAKVTLSYSLDGKTFTSVGQPFVSRPGRWVGSQIGLFAQAPAGTPSNTSTRIGWSDFDGFWVTP